jgi:hypothetical protein
LQWTAILASNILYEKFWQHNGVWGEISGRSGMYYMLSGTLTSYGWGVVPDCPGQTRDAPMDPYISHKNKAKREIHCSLVPNISCACCEADCPPMKPEGFVTGPQTGPNRAKQGGMGLQKPKFSGTTRNPGRSGHDSRAIGRNDHSLGTRQDASLSPCDSGGLSRGSSLVEKWIRVHMPGSWKPSELG